ncbi:MAG TPA: hypothetical protein DEO60_09165 [Bacteroidales bacterium]|jgi:hypothetical protein|nr:hypothetical protein [Bacteroidales bacterium]HBZ21286.1 hypothetical protein [Bacteroidales bacterium]
MKKFIFLGIFSILISPGALAQVSGPITFEKKGMKKVIMQDNKTLSAKQLASILNADQASTREFKAAKTNSLIGVASMGVGTVFLGAGLVYTLKAAQATNDGDLSGSTDYSNMSGAAMLVGAGFYLASLPFIIMSNSHMKKSINLYNSSHKTSSIDKIDLNIGFSGNGAMIQFRF